MKLRCQVCEPDDFDGILMEILMINSEDRWETVAERHVEFPTKNGIYPLTFLGYTCIYIHDYDIFWQVQTINV